MRERELLHELQRLEAEPTSAEDWRDLYETIEAYKLRCLARRVARAPRRVEMLATIRGLAEG